MKGVFGPRKDVVHSKSMVCFLNVLEVNTCSARLLVLKLSYLSLVSLLPFPAFLVGLPSWKVSQGK